MGAAVVQVSMALSYLQAVIGAAGVLKKGVEQDSGVFGVLPSVGRGPANTNSVPS